MTPLRLYLHRGWTDTVMTVIPRVEEGRKTGMKAVFGGREWLRDEMNGLIRLKG